MSKQYLDVCVAFFFRAEGRGERGGEYVLKPKFGDSRFFSEKKTSKGTSLGSISCVFH